jgi:hypothetical protein
MNVQAKIANDTQQQPRPSKIEHVRVLELLYSEELTTKTGSTFIKACIIADRTFFGKDGTAYASHQKEWVTLSHENLTKLKSAKGGSLVEMITRINGKYKNQSIRGVLS